MITPPAGSESLTPASLTPSSSAPIGAAPIPPSVHSRTEKSASLLVVRPAGGGMPDFAELTSTYSGKCIHTLDLKGADLRSGAWRFLGDFLKVLASLDTLDLSRIYYLCCSLQQRWIFNPLSKAGDRTHSLKETVLGS